MTEKDILTEFEEKDEPLAWHDELMLIAMLPMFLVAFVIYILIKFIKTKLIK